MSARIQELAPKAILTGESINHEHLAAHGSLFDFGERYVAVTGIQNSTTVP
jgi:hypothetical protein